MGWNNQEIEDPIFKEVPRGVWRSLVAHLLWEQRVAGSNPVTPTNRKSQSRLFQGTATKSPGLWGRKSSWVPSLTCCFAALGPGALFDLDTRRRRNGV